MLNDKDLARWAEINQQLRALTDAQYEIEQKLKRDFIKSHSQTYTLPFEATLNWREPMIVVATDKTGQPIVEVRELEFRGILNGRNSRTHAAGTTFTVLASWKTGKKTKGTHYLLYDKRSKRVANFYG